jgi:hypothetical protein
MSSKQSTEKSSGGGFSLSSLGNVIKMISAVFNAGQSPATSLPPPLILTGGNIRGGLSASNIASRVISRRSEAGLPTGDVFDGYPNTDELMVRIMSEEIINSILTESVVQVAIQPGTTVTGSGIGNLGAPIAVQGATTNIGTGKGIIS